MVIFRINKGDCFDEKDKTITVIQGNTVNINATLIDEETEKDIVLEENDVILWYVRTAAGREVVKRIFTVNDVNDDGSISLKLKPTDTIQIKPSPNAYQYGLTYMPNGGEDAWTYCIGKFVVLANCGSINDLTP